MFEELFHVVVLTQRPLVLLYAILGHVFIALILNVPWVTGYSMTGPLGKVFLSSRISPAISIIQLRYSQLYNSAFILNGGSIHESRGRCARD